MADKYWTGKATAVAQVSTIQITAFDAATTYKVTIGDVEVSVTGTTDVNGTASALQVALEASTHPYFSNITWTVSTDTVTGTAQKAGIPFVAASSVTGGTGTIGAVTTSTASAGPNDFSSAGNYSDETVPANTDVVEILNSNALILWGLDQNAVTLANFIIPKTFTGRIGMLVDNFITDVTGTTITTDSAATEYRQSYLKIGWDNLELGQPYGGGRAGGSSLVKLHNSKAGDSVTVVHDTATAGVSVGFPAAMFLFDNVGANLFQHGGLVGIAAERSDESVTMGDVNLIDGECYVGLGADLDNYAQEGGTGVINTENDITAITMRGGSLTTDGDFSATTFNQVGGSTIQRHKKTSGNAIGTLNLKGGVMDCLQDREARTFNSVVLGGGQLDVDPDIVTLTAVSLESGAKRSVSLG